MAKVSSVPSAEAGTTNFLAQQCIKGTDAEDAEGMRLCFSVQKQTLVGMMLRNSSGIWQSIDLSVYPMATLLALRPVTNGRVQV